jgi:hypothetical protein
MHTTTTTSDASNSSSSSSSSSSDASVAESTARALLLLRGGRQALPAHEFEKAWGAISSTARTALLSVVSAYEVCHIVLLTCKALLKLYI